ncbi:ATP synthase F1 subunit gamma [Candidatus Roizmanbacteria bacterium CG10_big_fil_rev_8_21_14_0_10_45_7]|uniref:ATP synthase gamma chain n=1 Tax=Candidatus Roizmanbacteria bacterium CG10_big_fil_rev_8_21_14_0_10_45_7 TaxID=1974854 RepID=A0A2M8KUI5_9BACT|nr:MAG: ATP synthase F1 subunit gamma [Candidatus Roizmanbacteria bacterium CG10_big_fil_rev_8_21_14_0_10_45_7]
MNLRQLKKKIKSVQNVGQITKAMQLVSAVKMKKAQAKALGGKPYRDALEETIARIAHSSSLGEYSFVQKNTAATKELVIVLSSNKGLCGIFNFNLFRFFGRTMQVADANYEFVTVGTKAQQFLIHAGASVIADFSNSYPTFEESATAIFRLAKDDFEKGKYKTVSILYNRFISSLVYRPVREILLPFSEIAIAQKTEQDVQKELEYAIEPTPHEVLKGLLDFYLESKIRGAVQESEASEHSARMIAMKNATDNAKDMVYSMTLLRNGLRQERITNELLDMNTARLTVSN